MNDIIHDHRGLTRCKFCYVTAVRSCDVIEGHRNAFANSLAQKRATALSLCSAHQDASNDIHFYLEVFTDLRPTSDLDLMKSSYTYIFWCVSTKGVMGWPRDTCCSQLHKCFGMLIGLSHIRHYIPENVIPTIVHGLVVSHVRYCLVYLFLGTAQTKTIGDFKR